MILHASAEFNICLRTKISQLNLGNVAVCVMQFDMLVHVYILQQKTNQRIFRQSYKLKFELHLSLFNYSHSHHVLYFSFSLQILPQKLNRTMTAQMAPKKISNKNKYNTMANIVKCLQKKHIQFYCKTGCHTKSIINGIWQFSLEADTFNRLIVEQF